MIKLKCYFVFLGLLVVVHSASVFSNPINIPVAIVYGDNPYEIYNAAGNNGEGRSSQRVKSPIKMRELIKLEDNYYGNPNAVRNLEEKVQLSPEQLLHAEKYLPLDRHIQHSNDVKSNLVEENSNPIINKDNPIETSTKAQEPSKPSEATYQNLGESTEQALSASTTEENLTDPNVVLLIQIAQNIVSSGLTNIRENIDRFVSNEANPNRNPISSQQWDRLNQTISDFFQNLLQVRQLTRNQDTVLQDIVVGVKGATNNFLENLRSVNNSDTVAPAIANDAAQVNQNATVSNANATDAVNATTPRPGIGQNIANLISNGINRITSGLNSIRNRTSTTVSSVAGEKDQATTPAPGPFQNIFNQIFGGATSSPPPPPPPGQADTATTPAPNRPIQNVVNQFNQAISGLNPFAPSTTAAPGSQGDESTTPGNIFQPVQNFVNQVINTFNPQHQNQQNQNQNASGGPAAPGSTAAPGAQNEGSTTQQPGPLLSVLNQVGQAVNNIFNPSSTPAPAPGTQSEENTTPGRPLQQAFQNVVNQVGSAINNFAPNRASTQAPVTQNSQTVQNGTSPANQAANAPAANTPQTVQNTADQVVSTLQTSVPPPQLISVQNQPAAPRDVNKKNTVVATDKVQSEEIMVAVD